ncbi:MAG TPA: PilN domain-containing protein [Coxiellaceae bacterium]|nr:MAG: hypothetical protein A3E81_04630 [Gammaproteobacteria bacterium RIFCSPHIGHO2_12_FULL_36_30]HLB55959.1 PilN domain-containing protein [Coxiellaceae bacterium]
MTTSIHITFIDHAQLRAAFKDLKLSSRKLSVVIDISSAHSIMRDITVESGLSDIEIMQFLKSHSTNLFGFSAEELCIDYETQSTIIDGKQKITAIAAHANLILHIEKLALQEKILISAIQVDKKMNLLPWREKQKQHHQQKILFGAIVFMIALFIIGLIANNFLKHQMRQFNLQSKMNAAKNGKIIVLRTQQHAALLNKLNIVHAQKLTSIYDNKNNAVLLSDIANDLPNDVTLTSLSMDDKKIKLTGVSNQLSDIHQYANNLKETLPQKQIELSEINNNQQNKSQMNFTIVARNENHIFKK